MKLTPRLALASVGGTVVFLGLAVLGGGGFAAFFSHSALTALAIATLGLAGAALFTRGNLSSGEREDRRNRWVIVALALLGLLAAYLPAYTDRKALWTLDGESFRWLGVALYAAGGTLRIWPVFVLGRRFSGWSPSSPDMRWSRTASMASSGTRTTWDSWSTRWGGPSRFAPGSACCSRPS